MMQQMRFWPACTRSWAAEAAGPVRKTAAKESLDSLSIRARSSCSMSLCSTVCYGDSEISTLMDPAGIQDAALQAPLHNELG